MRMATNLGKAKSKFPPTNRNKTLTGQNATGIARGIKPAQSTPPAPIESGIANVPVDPVSSRTRSSYAAAAASRLPGATATTITIAATKSPKNLSGHQVHCRDVFRPGLIICAPHHEPTFPRDANAPLLPFQKISACGIVGSKYRPLIVLACYANHYVALPMYTHNGKGLAEKPREEYMPVRSTATKTTATTQKDDEDEVILYAHCLPRIHQEVDAVGPIPAVHLTYPVSIKYGIACGLLWQLHEKSLLDLLYAIQNEKWVCLKGEE